MHVLTLSRVQLGRNVVVVYICMKDLLVYLKFAGSR